MLSIPHISQNHNFLPNLINSPLQPPLDLTRRMSASAALSATLYPPQDHHAHCRYNNQLTSSAFAYNPSPRPFYSSHIHRGPSTHSLRDFRLHHQEFSPHDVNSEWKHDIPSRHNFFDNRHDVYDEPISPLQPNFSGGLAASPSSAIPYSPISENPYGPSPPGTATSTSSSVAPLNSGPTMSCSPSLSITQHLQRSISTPNMVAETDTRTYAFVSLPGNAVKKRPRRRYDEIERLYQCSWPECTKAYGTLNHLNAHVTMQKHGPKRTPDEFKEMRKQWRRAKKDQSAAVAAGLLRRESFGEPYDDSTPYDHHYEPQQTSHSLHPICRSQTFQDDLGLPTSVSIAGERYNVPIDDIRYPPSSEREDDSPGDYSNSILSRSRYSSGLPASWHGNSGLSRSNSVHHHHQHQHHVRYEPASVPQYAHHSHLPHLTIGASVTRPPSPPPHSAPAHTQQYHHHSSMSVNRGGGLPESGVLLTTPLSGYHPDPSMVSPIQNGSGPANVIYTSERYELYDSDSTGRPGTGHTNASIS